MTQQRRATPLPSPTAILRREKETKEELWDMFYHDTQLREFPEHLARGLMRLTEKSLMARVMIDHMASRGIKTVEELGHRVYLGFDSFDTLECLRSPVAFRPTLHDPGGRRHKAYLLALCDIEWEQGKPKPIRQERPA